MSSRQDQLLKLIVESYSNTAEPVGSKFLVEAGELKVSGATVRNEMREMEEKGLLTHPHTSAGRIPTETGYRYYVENLMTPTAPQKKVKQDIQEVAMVEADEKIKTKTIGKYVAEITKGAVIIAFGTETVYYTGISNLFSQPEFRDYMHVVNFSAIFDQCEEKVDELFENIEENTTKVLIGEDNPLGSACSLVATKTNENLFALLGPMRMNYSFNVGLLNFIKESV